MNRRNFLKRIAAVAAGAVAVPMMVKSGSRTRPGLDKWHHRYTWAQVKGAYNYKDPPEDFLREVSKYPKAPVGTIHCAGGGRIYRYMKNCTTKQLIAGAQYANCRRCNRTDLHDHTRCTARS